MKAKHILLVFTLNGIVSICALLLLNSILGKDGYAKHSYFVSLSLVVNAIFYQWIRLDILRASKASLSERENKKYLNSGANVSFFLILLGFLVCYYTNDLAYLVSFLAAMSMGIYEILLAYTRLNEDGPKFTLLNLVRSFSLISLLSFIFLFNVSYITTLFVLMVSFLIATLFFFKNKFSSIDEIRLIHLKDVFPMLRRALYPATIVIFVMLGYYFVKLYAQSLLPEQDFQIYVFYYDVHSLVFLTIFLAFNYLYQSDIVKGYDSGDLRCFKKSFYCVSFAFFLSLLFLVISVIISNYGLFGYLDRPVDSIITFIIAKGLIVQGLKLQWLDHSYYLSKQYRKLAIVNILSVVFLFISCLSFEDLDIFNFSLIISLYFNVSFMLTLLSSWREINTMMFGRLMLILVTLSLSTDLLIWVFYGQE